MLTLLSVCSFIYFSFIMIPLMLCLESRNQLLSLKWVLLDWLLLYCQLCWLKLSLPPPSRKETWNFRWLFVLFLGKIIAQQFVSHCRITWLHLKLLFLFGYFEDKTGKAWDKINSWFSGGCLCRDIIDWWSHGGFAFAGPMKIGRWPHYMFLDS